MKNNQTSSSSAADLAGLATACTLAARGYAVTVVEKNEWLGGKAALLEDRGYRFDMGPTILTCLPCCVESSRKPADRWKTISEMVRLDPQWRCFFEDGTQFDLVESLPEMKNSLRNSPAPIGPAADTRSS